MNLPMTKLTDENYVCEMCGCIVHGSYLFIENHKMWHMMIKDIWENIHGPNFFKGIK